MRSTGFHTSSTGKITRKKTMRHMVVIAAHAKRMMRKMYQFHLIPITKIKQISIRNTDNLIRPVAFLMVQIHNDILPIKLRIHRLTRMKILNFHPQQVKKTVAHPIY